MNEKKNRTSNGYKQNEAVNEFISTRSVLNIIVFVGFMVNYMLRVNLTFAIVEMVVNKPQPVPANDTNTPVLNRTARDVYAFVTENSLQHAKIASFQQLRLGPAEGNSDDRQLKPSENSQFEIPNAFEPDDDENSFDGLSILNGKHSRNLVSGESELQDSADVTSALSSTNVTNSNDTDSRLNGTDTFKLKTILQIDRVKRFEWTEFQQNLLIGSFFWGYICTEIPGGRLSEIYGPRKVFGYATLAATVLTLLTPLAAKIHFIVLLICRILLGFSLGPTWPAILPLAAKWIPPDERGKFLSNMMASTLGAGFTLPVCGYIIAILSWEYVFYITGLVSLLWCIVWFMYVYDTPAAHPRISHTERRYIETALGTPSAVEDAEENQVVQRLMGDRENAKDSNDSDQSDADCRSPNSNGDACSAVLKCDCQNYPVNGKYKKNYEPTSDGETHALQPVRSPSIQVLKSSSSLSTKHEKADNTQQSNSARGSAPWGRILTSLPVWAFVLTHGASVFGYFTITNQLPTFAKSVLHYDIKKNGVLSGLPYIGKYLSALIGGSIADYLLGSSILSRNAVRKLFTFMGVMVPGFIMLVQVFLGSHKVLSIIVFILTMVANGFVTGGYLGNSLELAPNYSGTIFGLANMFSGLAGTLSALLVGYVTDKQQEVYGQWQKVFATVAAVYIIGASLFLIFGSTKVQPWAGQEPHEKKSSTNGANNT